MKRIQYNKLVRDKIPKIIETQGKKAVTTTLTDDQFLSMLDKKLIEETSEYIESGSIEELADIAEVLLSILNARKISIQELIDIREKKVDARGGFKEKILLIEVIED